MNIRKDLLKEYLANQINRANHLYRLLHGGSTVCSRQGMEERAEQFKEYEFITEMFRQINLFDWINEITCSSNDINIIK